MQLMYDFLFCNGSTDNIIFISKNYEKQPYKFLYIENVAVALELVLSIIVSYPKKGLPEK